VHVEALLAQGGRVTGVRTADGERTFDAVICNADAAALAAGLFGEEGRVVTPPAPRSLSAVTWLLRAEAQGFPLARHTVFFGAEPRREFTQLFDERCPVPRAFLDQMGQQGLDVALVAEKGGRVGAVQPVDRRIDLERAAHTGSQRAHEHRIGQLVEAIGLQGLQLLDRHLQRHSQRRQFNTGGLARLAQQLAGRGLWYRCDRLDRRRVCYRRAAADDLITH
jgi:phytoene dehydrogenase-like protein